MTIEQRPKGDSMNYGGSTFLAQGTESTVSGAGRMIGEGSRKGTDPTNFSLHFHFHSVPNT